MAAALRTRKADPITTHLFILVLEIAFLSIKDIKNTKSLHIFDHTTLYIAYADDTTFFRKDKESLIEVMKVFDTFSSLSGLKPNKSKYEVAGIGALKGAKLVLCCMKCTDLRSITVKILGIHFSFNKKIENDENFLKRITSIEKVLKLCANLKFDIRRKNQCFQSISKVQDRSSNINHYYPNINY